jgi:hypothetical protein
MIGGGLAMGDRFSRRLQRALRRLHRTRLIGHCKKVMKQRGIVRDGSWLERWSLRNHDHFTTCSCFRCGNSRRYYGVPTVQEQRETQDELTALLED